MSEIYPEIEPYQVGRLKVSDLHDLHYELIGNPKGKPAVYLHGGPGSGCNPFTDDISIQKNIILLCLINVVAEKVHRTMN